MHLIRIVGFGVGVAALTVASCGGAAETDAPAVAIAIRAGSLERALQDYGRQSHRQLLYRSDLVAGVNVRALDGIFTPDDALRRLLAGTTIAFHSPRANVIVLDHALPEAPPRLPGAAAPSPHTTHPRQPPASAGSVAATIGDIVVTGSHIRGGGAGASPTTVITRSEIDRLGRATLAEVFATLPQNFTGTASEQSALTLADGSGTNASLATGVNLRGLGAGATLVLVNGRRVAGSGTLGEFGDISSVPTAAVDRVEVLLDGASAIYGSDAVGGVVNIIFKDRYQGAETRLEAGTVTRGGAREVQAAQTIGTTWASGSALLAYEYYHRDALASSSRDYAASADLRPLGGTDHRQFYSQPGNILALDPLTGAFGPAYAIPAGQNGTRLAPGSFVAGSVNLENQRMGTDLLPSQDRHSLYARAVETLGDTVTLSVDGRYANRRFAVRGTGSPAVIVVTPANPFFVAPDGSPYDLIAYSFARELGASRTSGSAATIATSGGAEITIGRWKARPYIAFAQQLERNDVTNIVNTQLLSEELGSAPVAAGAPYNRAVDGYFNPFGDGAVNSRGVLDFVARGFQAFESRSRVTTYNVDADGPLVELPGGTAKLAVGANVRREAFTTSGVVFLFSDLPSVTAPRSSMRTVAAAFAEARLPLVGPGNARPGVGLLDVTLAGRFENYSDFGSTTNPKVGIEWVPAKGARLRASFGTSFRAPNLRQISDPERISATILSTPAGGQSAVLLLAGGNPSLGPEKAETWTAGIDVTPPALAGVRLSATWFRTDFRSRIGRPALDDLTDALTNPALSPFVTRVSPATNAGDLARVTALINDPASIVHGSYAPTTIGAIVDARYVNTASTLVDGVDWTLGYAFAVGQSHFDLAATGSNLFDYREQLTPTAGRLNNINLVGKPLAFRARVSGEWTRSAVGAGLAVNFANAYHDLAGQPVAAWATLDLQLRYTAPDTSGALRGLVLALNAQNLTEQNPPFVNSAAGVGYDAANADALGRFVSVQLTKRW